MISSSRKSSMKILFIALSFILGTCLVGDAQTMGVKSKTRVLVIGISDYQDEKITDLKFAHKDAEAFRNYIQSK